jgi:hypothetical protein
MKKILEKDAAYQSLTIRVLVPKKDIDNIFRSVNELSMLILDIIPQEDDRMIILELYLNSAFNLYALGKLVGYCEVYNK